MIHRRDGTPIARRVFLAEATAAGAALTADRTAAAESERSTAGLIPVGVAKVDVTPDYPVRLPTRFAPAVEDRIVATAKALLPDGFQSDA